MSRGVLIMSLINLSNIFTVSSTHIRGGFIYAERTSNSTLTYRVNLVILTDSGSSVVFGGGDVDFGDGEVVKIKEGADSFNEGVMIDPERLIALNKAAITHTFSAPGIYTISFGEKSRNVGVLNMDNSVDTPFYVETTIHIDPFLGINNTPVIENLSLHNWFVGVANVFNLAASDVDGDSLSYRLGVPKQFRDKEVDQYTSPVNPKFYGDFFLVGNEPEDDSPSFNIDPISGDLIWDAPGVEGEYTALIIVDEWREVQGERYNIGNVSYDIGMIVEGDEVSKPTIVFPENQCYDENSIVEELFHIDGQGKVKVNLYTDAVGAKINNTPIEGYDFDQWKDSYDLIFSYDTKNAHQKYYKVVLGVEQESGTSPNYFWSKAFVFGLGCDKIVAFPQTVTSILAEKPDLKVNVFFTHTTGQISFNQPLTNDVDFQMFDLNGRLILKKEISFFQGKSQIQYEPIPSGVYIVNLVIDFHLYKQKVLIR